MGGEEKMILLSLFWEFFKTGLFSIGGGLATLPFLYDMGERTGWFSSADVTNMLAVSESTPGAIGINMSTFAGYTTGGVPGALVATLGLITPSIIIILLVAMALRSFQDNCYVGRALYALRGASNGLITAAGCNVFAVVMLNLALFHETGRLLDLVRWREGVLFLVILVLTNFIRQTKKLHPVVFIAFSAAVGIVFHFGGT
jgi:chromate transporter